MGDLVVAGGGMAGLSAAVRARELGADVVVHEKGDRPGGSMLLSSGVVWRYREWETFRNECPGGRSGPPASRVGGSRRRRRVARVAGRAGGRARHREPAHDRGPLRPARADRDPCRPGGGDPPGRAAGGGSRRRPRRPGDGRLPGRPRARPRARHSGGRRPRPPCQPVERGRRATAGRRARSVALGRPGRVLRAEPRRGATDRARGLRPAGPGLRPPRDRRERPGRALRGADVVGDRRRPVDGSAAGRPRLVLGRGRGPRRAHPRAHRRRRHRARPAGRRPGRTRRRSHEGRGRRRHHRHAGRHPGGRARPGGGRSLGGRGRRRRHLDGWLGELARLGAGSRPGRRRGRRRPASP